MTKPEVGNNAGSECTPMGSISKPKTISPAARKFAEYIARHMVPMIEGAGVKRTEPTQQTNGPVAVYTQKKGD